MTKIILLLFVLLSYSTTAQELNDRIFKKDGDSIICKITKIQGHWISFDYKGKKKIINDHIYIDDVTSYTYNSIVNKTNEKDSEKKVKNKDVSPPTVFVEPKTILRLRLIVPGILVEQKIANNTTLIFNLWTGFAIWGSSSNGVATSGFDFQPNFTIEPRFYPNLDKRKSIGKRTDCFSGGYIGIPITVGLSDPRFSAGPVGGFQRTLGKRGYWNIAIGVGVKGYLGINGYQSETLVGFIGEFGLGFILNFKKKNAKTNIQ